MPYWDDHQPGHTTITASRTIADADIAAFSALSGDNHPLQTDADYARRSRFGGIVAHGPLVLTIAHGLMARCGLFADVDGAFLGLTWRMRAPARPGDTLRVRVTVESRRDSRGDAGRGVVEFRFAAINQNSAVVGDGTWSHLFAKRPRAA